MKVLAWFALALALAAFNANSAEAKKYKRARVFILVDISDKELTLYVDGERDTSWYVSTGAEEYLCPPEGHCYYARTPIGTFRPYRMHREYRSRLWGGAKMDYAIFFKGGVALHATDEEYTLGRANSGGCVRQETHMAKYLFEIVERYGMRNTVIKVRR